MKVFAIWDWTVEGDCLCSVELDPSFGTQVRAAVVLCLCDHPFLECLLENAGSNYDDVLESVLNGIVSVKH